MANITRRNLVIIYVFRCNIKVNINKILTDKKSSINIIQILIIICYINFYHLSLHPFNKDRTTKLPFFNNNIILNFKNN